MLGASFVLWALALAAPGPGPADGADLDVPAPSAVIDGRAEYATDDPAGLFLAAAEAAHRQGEAARRDTYLRAWATLGARPPAPAALAEPAAAAQQWASSAGAFRLFASRHGDRVRIGMNDPAQLVTRVEATGRSADRATVLARADGEVPGRFEHVLDPALGEDARVEIRAWADGVEPPVLVRRILVGGAEAGPVAPDPTSLRGVPDRLRDAPVGVAEAAQADRWPWWWFAAGAVALGLAGAAVWQEAQP